MCWNPRPSGEVFASEQASDVAVRLCFKIAEELEKQRDALSNDYLPQTVVKANHALLRTRRVRTIWIRSIHGAGDPTRREPPTTSIIAPSASLHRCWRAD